MIYIGGPLTLHKCIYSSTVLLKLDAGEGIEQIPGRYLSVFYRRIEKDRTHYSFPTNSGPYASSFPGPRSIILTVVIARELDIQFKKFDTLSCFRAIFSSIT